MVRSFDGLFDDYQKFSKFFSFFNFVKKSNLFIWVNFIFKVDVLADKLSDNLPPGGLQRENLFAVHVYCINSKICTNIYRNPFTFYRLQIFKGF